MLTKEQQKQNLKEFRKQLAEDLIRMREEKGLTQEEVSRATRISLTYIQNAERGETQNWGHIYLFAKFYDKKIRIIFKD